MKHYSGELFGKVRHAQELQDLWERQGGKCAYSGLPLTLGLDAEIDHIIPESGGGPTEIGNLQWVHTMVNQMKFCYPERDFLAMVEMIYCYRCAQG